MKDENEKWEITRNVFYTNEYKVVCTHSKDCPYAHIPPPQCPRCKIHPNPQLDNLMRWDDDNRHTEDGDFVIGSAIISEQKGNDDDFPIHTQKG